MKYSLGLAGLIVTTAAFGADFVNQPTLTLEGAKRVAAAAVEFARAHNAPGASIAVVDAGGHTIYVERLDGTFSAGTDISVGKARTAIAFERPTRGIEEGIKKGRTAMVDVAAVTWFTPSDGSLYFTNPPFGGKHLGTIRAPKAVHNFALGGNDGRTLYLCARSALYRVQLLIPGIRP